jgi:hypothetical protein
MPMAVHIDRVMTEVVPEPEPGTGAAAAGAPAPWDETDRARAALAVLTRDQCRTRAEGFDD